MIEVALVIALAIALVAVIGGFLLARSAPAQAAKALANGEEMLKERDAKKKAEQERDDAIARGTFDKARADEVTEQLEATQRELNTATLELAAIEQERVLGMTDEQALAAVNSRLKTPLSARPDSALEKP